jgi:hypothetical protein
MKNSPVTFFQILLFIFSLNLSAQSIQVGPKVIEDKMWMTKSFVAEEANKIFVFNMGTEISQIECFDQLTLSSVYKKNIEIPYLRVNQGPVSNPKEMLDDHNVFFHNGSLLYLSAWFNKKEKKYDVLGQSFRSHDGEKIQDVKIITSALIDKEQSRGEEYPKYHFIQSADKKNILIISYYSNKQSHVQKGTDTKIVRTTQIPESEFQYKIVDFDLKEVSAGIIKTKGVARDFILNSNGHILYISAFPKDIDSYFDYSVWDYDTQTKSETKLAINDLNKEITSIQVKIINDFTYVAGFYNNSNEDKGIFCVKLSKDNTLEKKAIHPIANLQDESKNPKGLTNPLPSINEICINENGEMILIGESSNTYLYKTYKYSFLGEKTSTAYSPTSHALMFYGNIVVTCLDPNFNLKWTGTFNKSQKLNYDAGYSSFGFLNSNKHFYCFFNEITAPVNMMMPPAAKGISIGSINSKGETDLKVIGAEEPNKMIIKASTFYQNGKAYYTFGKSGKDNVLFKITE